MNKAVIRILSIELNHFKNVEYGYIELSKPNIQNIDSISADILGIYGQNGSGKTAVIDAIGFLQDLLSGESLCADASEYISKGTDTATLAFTFEIMREEEKYLANYSFSIRQGADESTEISEEVLSYSEFINGKWSTRRDIVNYHPYKEKSTFTPQYRFKQFSADKNTLLNLHVAMVVSQKEHSSFIFSSEGRKVLLSGLIEEPQLTNIIMSLWHFASYNLFVINNSHTGVISLNLMPFSFKLEDESGIRKGDLTISLNEPNIISNESKQTLSELVSGMNVVLSSLIPGMQVEIKEYGQQLRKDGTEGIRLELISVRDGKSIPLRYESEGIKKLLSILNVCIAVYNSPSICLVADELDAGIFEYLLGEILSIIQDGGKGQLLFTSHNLRPLEMIDKNSLVFTTTNPGNRYIRLLNVKTSNNLRDLYLRSINLGGQKEEIYESTNTFEISRAFRKAGARLVK